MVEAVTEDFLIGNLGVKPTGPQAVAMQSYVRGCSVSLPNVDTCWCAQQNVAPDSMQGSTEPLFSGSISNQAGLRIQSSDSQ